MFKTLEIWRLAPRTGRLAEQFVNRVSRSAPLTRLFSRLIYLEIDIFFQKNV